MGIIKKLADKFSEGMDHHYTTQGGGHATNSSPYQQSAPPQDTHGYGSNNNYAPTQSPYTQTPPQQSQYPAFTNAQSAYPPIGGSHQAHNPSYPPASAQYPPIANGAPSFHSGMYQTPQGTSKPAQLDPVQSGHIYGRPTAPSQHGMHQSPSAPPPPTGDNRRRKAVVIGCNYPRQQAALSGCINDAKCMMYLLQTKFNFPEDQILLLTDDQREHSKIPTRRNIEAAMRWLVADARSGDSLFFHFSGHGAQKRDRTGDEDDGLNETILPTDFRQAGQIEDDRINRLLVNPLPQGATLHAVIDACHSGTAMDLPFYTTLEKGSQRFKWKAAYPYGSKVYKGTSGGVCYQIGAALDCQTAADTNSLSNDRVHTGAATYLFIDAIEKYGSHCTYAQLLAHMLTRIKEVNRKTGYSGGMGGGGLLQGALMGGLFGGLDGALMGAMLGGGMSAMNSGRISGQTPQLSCSTRMDLNQPLSL